MFCKRWVMLFFVIIAVSFQITQTRNKSIHSWYRSLNKTSNVPRFSMQENIDAEDASVDYVDKDQGASEDVTVDQKDVNELSTSDDIDTERDQDNNQNEKHAQGVHNVDLDKDEEEFNVEKGSDQVGQESSSLLHYVMPLETDFDDEKNNQEVNNDAKREMAHMLINRAVDFFTTRPTEEALRVFNHTKHFFKSGMYVFVHDQEGVCLADLRRPESLWKNTYNKKDSYGRYPTQELIEKGNNGGGWVEYVWQGSATQVYVKRVIKDNRSYYLSCGFFTHQKHDAVVNLVKSGVTFFKKMIKQGTPAKIAFASLGYKAGNFFQGDLHLYVVRYDGLMVAHGEHPEYVGENVLEFKNHEGKYENKLIISGLKNSSEGTWVSVKSRNTIKKVYAEEIKDVEGNSYFIACGYYPDANRDKVVDLVRNAYSYMKTHGKTVALTEFTGRHADMFEYGDLYITAYTEKGVCIANGKFYDDIGQNFINKQDDEGHYYIRQIIAKSKIGGGWINYKNNNMHHSVYIQPIDIGVEKLIITCGLYPISRKDTMMLMVKSAIGHLETVPFAQAMRDFIKLKSKFRRGDLDIFVLDANGMCFAYGSEYDLIWRNLINLKNEDGLLLIKKMIKVASHGPSLIRYTLNGSQKVSYVESVEKDICRAPAGALQISYVESVEKDGKKYIVGSSYYL